MGIYGLKTNNSVQNKIKHKNHIIDNMISRNLFKRLIFYFKLKFTKVDYDTLNSYIDFLIWYRKIFRVPNSSIYVDTKYGENLSLILSETYSTIHVTPIINKQIRIEIYLDDQHLSIKISDLDKLDDYEKYIVNDIFSTIKEQILKIYMRYSFF